MSNNDGEGGLNSKRKSRKKKPSRTTEWRDDKDDEIRIEEDKLETLKGENCQVAENITALFGALAYKYGKPIHLKTLQKRYLFQHEHLHDYFRVDKIDKETCKQLQESLQASDKRGRPATYLRILRERRKSQEEILAMRLKLQKQLSKDIYNPQG